MAHETKATTPAPAPDLATALLAPLVRAVEIEVGELQAARAAAGQAQAEVAALRGALATLHQERDALTRSVATLQQQEQAARQGAQQAESLRATTAADLQRQSGQLETLEREIAAHRGVLRELQQQREVTEANTRGAVGVLQAQQQFAERAAHLAVAGAEEARKNLSDLETERAVAEQQLTHLREQVQEARQEAEHLRSEVTAARAEARQVGGERDGMMSAAQVARRELAELEQRRAELQREVQALGTRERLLAALPEPVEALLAALPERLRERATDSLFVRVPAVDREALERAAKVQRAKVQELVRDALRTYLGQEAYQAALDALHGSGKAQDA